MRSILSEINNDNDVQLQPDLGKFVYIQEEEERKRKEEQERKEHEEYLLLKEQFTVEEEGVGETAEEVSDCILLTVRE